jgi:tyrosine-specific transport protein
MAIVSNIRFIGGVLLVAGTTIGAGMLALPVVTSFGGFFPSAIIFGLCWLLMLCSAFFFLDVNLAVRGEPNLISMAGKTLGVPGKVASWVFYLLLLYSLLAAYIAASAPLFERAVFALTDVHIPATLSRFCLPVVFGSFIYLGTKGVDYINRLLMIGLGLSYVMLVAFIPSHIEISLLTHFDFSASLLAIPVVLTSFGYHIIIPSLTTYLNHDTKLLRKTIIWGSILPIVIYLVWQVLTLGVIPQGYLSQAWIQGVPATEPLAFLLNNSFIAKSALFFSFFAIVTSFLGVSLSLSDFLTDGLKIKKTWEGRFIAFGLTFVPPLIFVFSYQRGFYLALEYAGIIVAILLGIMPSLMAWRLKGHPFYRSFLGKLLISLVILLCLGAILLDFLEKKGVLRELISPYLSLLG